MTQQQPVEVQKEASFAERHLVSDSALIHPDSLSSARFHKSLPVICPPLPWWR